MGVFPPDEGLETIKSDMVNLSEKIKRATLSGEFRLACSFDLVKVKEQLDDFLVAYNGDSGH